MPIAVSKLYFDVFQRIQSPERYFLWYRITRYLSIASFVTFQNCLEKGEEIYCQLLSDLNNYSIYHSLPIEIAVKSRLFLLINSFACWQFNRIFLYTLIYNHKFHLHFIINKDAFAQLQLHSPSIVNSLSPIFSLYHLNHSIVIKSYRNLESAHHIWESFVTLVSLLRNEEDPFCFCF